MVAVLLHLQCVSKFNLYKNATSARRLSCSFYASRVQKLHIPIHCMYKIIIIKCNKIIQQNIESCALNAEPVRKTPKNCKIFSKNCTSVISWSLVWRNLYFFFNGSSINVFKPYHLCCVAFITNKSCVYLTEPPNTKNSCAPLTFITK